MPLDQDVNKEIRKEGVLKRLGNAVTDKVLNFQERLDNSAEYLDFLNTYDQIVPKDIWRAGLTFLGVGTLMTGCSDGGPTNGGGDENQKPSISGQMSPTEGIAPLIVDIEYTGTDPDNNFEGFIVDNGVKKDTIRGKNLDIQRELEEEGTYNITVRGFDTKNALSNPDSEVINVQSNKPIFTTQGQDWNIIEGKTKAYALSDLVKNGTITNAGIDSPASVEIKDDTLFIYGGDFSEADINRALQLYAENENGTNEENVDVNLEGRTDAHIKLGLLGRNGNITGEVDIYNKNGDKIKTIQVPQNGKKVQLDNSEEYRITAFNLNGNAYNGRTKTFKPNQKGADIQATIKALAHPRSNTGLTPAQKQAYIEETDFRAGYVNDTAGVIIDLETEGPFGRKVKWKKNSIEGVYIIEKDLTNSQVQTVIDKLNNKNDDIGACLQAIDDDYRIETGDGNNHEALTPQGKINDGWIVFEADNNFGKFGLTSYIIGDDYNITATSIIVNPEKINNLTDAFEYVTAHEFLHTFSGFAEHTKSVPRSKTIMQGGLGADETRKKPEQIDLQNCIEYNDSNLSVGQELNKLYNFQ